MKKLLFSLLSMSVVSLPALAETITYKDSSAGVYYDLDTETLTAVIYGSPRTNRGSYIPEYEGVSLTIPETVTYEGTTYAVTVVGSFHFSPNLEELIIAHQVELSESSFSYCKKLRSITLPEGITHIPDGCFSQTAITDIDFLPSTIKTIGSRHNFWSFLSNTGAFENCESLKSVSLPPSVTSLGANTFSYCKSLSVVTLNEGLEVISRSCFGYDTSLTSVSIPSTVIEIGKYTFSDSGLEQIELSDGIQMIGGDCFERSNISSIKLPENLESIRVNLLKQTHVKELSIPSGVKRIMPRGLASISTLTNIYIEDSEETLEFDIVANNRQGRDPWPEDGSQDGDACGQWFMNTHIAELYLGRNSAIWFPDDWVNPPYEGADLVIVNPFEELTELKNITIGKLVTDASQLAFEKYPLLETVTFLSTAPPALCPLTPEQAETVIVTVPKGCVDAYRSVEGWADVKNYREDESSSKEPSASFSLSDTKIELTEGETKQLTIDVTGLKAGKSTLTVILTDENGEEETAICEIIVVENESDVVEAFRDTEEKAVDIYNLNGVLLKSQVTPEAVLNLPRGIYIVGGKKVLVK